jgi:hypothetical protein
MMMGWGWSGGGKGKGQLLGPSRPLGSVAGDPDQHRAPGLAPLPLLRAGAGGFRPGAEAARVLGSQAVAAALKYIPRHGL